jgi:hypothetical protein
MTDRKISPDPLFAGPAGGTATRLCKRPELARERLELGDLRASGGGSRLEGEEWTYRVSAQIEAGPPSRVERMALDLPARAALGFGLDLVEGAAYCYRPGRVAGVDDPRPTSPLPRGEALRLLALAAQAVAQRLPETEADLAFLRDLVGRTWPGESALAGRHERELDALRRAGLIKVVGFGGQTQATATDDGRALAAMIGAAERPGGAA